MYTSSLELCTYVSIIYSHIDVDECLLNVHICDENAYCMDNEGSFFCTCNHGYTGDGFTCCEYTLIYYSDATMYYVYCNS